MASSEGDQLPEDGFDSLLDINEADMFQNKKELQLGKGCLASEVVSEKDSYCKCQFCTKICISKEDFLKHFRAKHIDKATDMPYSRQGTWTSCNSKLKITALIHMYVKSAENLANDECYPEGVTQQFQSFEISRWHH